MVVVVVVELRLLLLAHHVLAERMLLVGGLLLIVDVGAQTRVRVAVGVDARALGVLLLAVAQLLAVGRAHQRAARLVAELLLVAGHRGQQARAAELARGLRLQRVGVVRVLVQVVRLLAARLEVVVVRVRAVTEMLAVTRGRGVGLVARHRGMLVVLVVLVELELVRRARLELAGGGVVRLLLLEADLLIRSGVLGVVRVHGRGVGARVAVARVAGRRVGRARLVAGQLGLGAERVRLLARVGARLWLLLAHGRRMMGGVRMWVGQRARARHLGGGQLLVGYGYRDRGRAHRSRLAGRLLARCARPVEAAALWLATRGHLVGWRVAARLGRRRRHCGPARRRGGARGRGGRGRVRGARRARRQRRRGGGDCARGGGGGAGGAAPARRRHAHAGGRGPLQIAITVVVVIIVAEAARLVGVGASGIVVRTVVVVAAVAHTQVAARARGRRGDLLGRLGGLIANDPVDR